MFDAIRRAFADANQVSPALFSFNAQGSCPECKGRGFLEVELSFLDDVRLDCKVCEGRRYRDDVLKLTYHGRSIHDVLEMTVADALGFFASVEDPEPRPADRNQRASPAPLRTDRVRRSRWSPRPGSPWRSSSTSATMARLPVCSSPSSTPYRTPAVTRAGDRRVVSKRVLTHGAQSEVDLDLFRDGAGESRQGGNDSAFPRTGGWLSLSASCPDSAPSP